MGFCVIGDERLAEASSAGYRSKGRRCWALVSPSLQSARRNSRGPPPDLRANAKYGRMPAGSNRRNWFGGVRRRRQDLCSRLSRPQQLSRKNDYVRLSKTSRKTKNTKESPLRQRTLRCLSATLRVRKTLRNAMYSARGRPDRSASETDSGRGEFCPDQLEAELITRPVTGEGGGIGWVEQFPQGVLLPNYIPNNLRKFYRSFSWLF